MKSIYLGEGVSVAEEQVFGTTGDLGVLFPVLEVWCFFYYPFPVPSVHAVSSLVSVQNPASDLREVL